jgi:hypothetical protein
MTDASVPPAQTLLQIIGPPAVGKMTVGHEIALRTGLRLFHNHMTIEPVLRFFDFGSPQFGRLVGEFRRRLMEEVAASDLPGLIFTYVCAFDKPEDQEALDAYAAPFRERGARVLVLELEASQEERLRRNEGAFRLAEKPSKRDVQASRRHLREVDGLHRLNSTGEYDGYENYLRVDNTHSSPEEVAEHVIQRFGLVRTDARPV